MSKSSEHNPDKAAVAAGMGNHTFVALIDVVFTDGTKRTCTGTIIHDNVVVTARHCFGKTHDKFLQPEISASFVVIGSKKMFESGYEQYLPIEKIVSHPKYKGWMADIALVYTFAGMMSDKPGTIIPLADEKLSIPSHSNVTVFSWGPCKLAEVQTEEENDHSDRKEPTKYLEAKSSGSKEKFVLKSHQKRNPKTLTQLKYGSVESKKGKSGKIWFKNFENTKKQYTPEAGRVTKGIYRSQTLPSDETDEISLESQSDIHPKLRSDDTRNHGSTSNNWRRNMGPEKNELSVENFRFIPMHKCEKMLKRALPERHKLKNPNEFICYGSAEHFVTDADAGAPSVRHGYLVAVTVGGVECDDEHVAVGIKISCFCDWIADNLPDGGANLKCCKNCCDEAKETTPNVEDKPETYLRKGKHKKVRS